LSTEGTGLPFSGVMTATVLLASSMTLAMGLYARLPYAVAPGMGLNAFFTFRIVLAEHVPWPIALGLVTWAGVAFGIVGATLLGAAVGEVHAPAKWVSAPDFSLVGRADLRGALRLVYVPAALAIVFTDLFDSLSTFVGVAHATGMVDERGQPERLGR